jgi:macrolide-specific efflux system membrane fusion protein
MRRLWWAASAVMVVTAAGATLPFLRQSSDAAVTRYLTAPVTRRTVADTITATGTVAPAQALALSWGGPGGQSASAGSGSSSSTTTTITPGGTVVKAVSAHVGDQVKAGRSLATIDDSAQQAALASAAQRLTAAQTKADSSIPTLAPSQTPENLLAQTAEHQSDLAAVQDAEQVVATAQAAVKATTLTAPVDGVITAVNVLAGLPAPAGPAIGMRSGSMVVSASITEADVVHLQQGQVARVVFTALGTGTAAKVAAPPIAASTSGSSGAVVTFPVQLTLDQAVTGLLPGMSAQIVITVQQRPNVLAVQTAAIRGGRAQYSVQVLQNGQPVARPVQIGLSTAAYTEIIGGLQDGEQVVTGTVTNGSTAQPSLTRSTGG